MCKFITLPNVHPSTHWYGLLWCYNKKCSPVRFYSSAGYFWEAHIYSKRTWHAVIPAVTLGMNIVFEHLLRISLDFTKWRFGRQKVFGTASVAAYFQRMCCFWMLRILTTGNNLFALDEGAAWVELSGGSTCETHPLVSNSLDNYLMYFFYMGAAIAVVERFAHLLLHAKAPQFKTRRRHEPGRSGS